ncbi:MAG: lytic murein transglycosylase [Pseudomonadales bacterium]|nr:lytic murein transglycosylase [Pseudomonadales bacterium]
MGLVQPLQAEDQERPDFQTWLKGIRAQALAEGISEATVQRALTNLEPDPRVLKFDRRQPEFVQTFEAYLTARVTDTKVSKARDFYQDNRTLLRALAEKYEVDPQYLVAFWGLESSFGLYQGKYSVIRSLATLAHDPRRTRFFTSELMSALKVLDEGHIEPDLFVGGWAGAMGQNQFLPSSFLRYAQDFDGDGKKNIWSSRPDVWASIAYYLQRNGWQQGESWGMPVVLTQPIEFEQLKPATVPGGCRALKYHTVKRPLSDWQAMGVQLPGPVADTSVEMAMVVPDEGEQRAYLVGPNFRTILAYNCANKYAVSIGLMADAIVADPE